MLAHPHPRARRAARSASSAWGTLGRGVAKVGEAFGMRVIVCNRPGAAPEPGRVGLDELLGAADIVSLHCPLDAGDARA